MDKINIGKCIARKRRERNITQDELAKYIGVSKASVSKWETGQSYPDIVFLPELATYFNISVDELLGYSPQITKNEIQKRYNYFSKIYNSSNFDSLNKEIQNDIKKYYSCFPYMLAISQWYLNYSNYTVEKYEKNYMLEQSIKLCIHVREESKDLELIKTSNTIESLAHLSLNEPEKVINLLGNLLSPYEGEDLIFLTAYKQSGAIDEALVNNQILIYERVISLLSLLNNYLSLNINNKEIFETIYNQGKSLIKEFCMEKIETNAVFGIHITAAQGYILQEKDEKALKALEDYYNVVSNFTFPLQLTGNDYFNKIDNWIEESSLIGRTTPIDENQIKNNFISIISKNPVFEKLKDNSRFKSLLWKLNNKFGGDLR